MFRALLLGFGALLVLIGGLLGAPAPAHALVPVGHQCRVQLPNGLWSSWFSSCQPAADSFLGNPSIPPESTFTCAPAYPATTPCFQTTRDYPQYGITAEWNSSCPANSSPSGSSCACNTGYSESGSACVPTPQCQFGTTVKSGYFDYGKDPAGAPPTLVCAGGCSALFFGDVPAGSALVDGTKHWFAKGSYQMSGGTCDPSADGTAGVPTGTGSIPSDSCGSNQTQGTVTANGKTQTVCVDKLPDDPSKAGQPAPTNEVNESKGSNTTINITNNADGSKTIVTTTINNNGNGTTTKTTTTETKDSSGQTTGSTTKTETTGKQTDQQQQQDKCQQNSSAEGCGGSPKDVGGSTLYTAKDKTAASVLSGAKDTIMGSGIGSAMGGFFAVAGGGSCTGIHGTVTVFDRAMSLDSDVFCSSFAANAFLLIRAVILVLAAWWAFRIAVE